MKGRVLLLVDEGTGSLASVRALRAAGYDPYVGFFQNDAYAARSRAAAGQVELPDMDDPENFVRATAAATQRLSISAVLPATEVSLRALSGREHLFPAGVTIGTNPVPQLDLATDKARLEELAARAGLEAPKSVIVTPAADAGARLGDVRYPAIVKPLRSALTVEDGALQVFGVTRVENEAELREALAAAPEETWIAQTYVEGTLAAICGVAWKGELVCATHQISRRIWPIGKGISSFATTVPPDAGRQGGLARVVAELGWSGVVGIQFIVNEDGAFVIDLNPRIYGSIGLAVAAGQNLPAIWADLLLGRMPLVRPYRVGVNYRFETNDYRALAQELRHGDRRGALTGLAPRRHTTHGIFSWRDPAPMLTVARLALGR